MTPEVRTLHSAADETIGQISHLRRILGDDPYPEQHEHLEALEAEFLALFFRLLEAWATAALKPYPDVAFVFWHFPVSRNTRPAMIMKFIGRVDASAGANFARDHESLLDSRVFNGALDRLLAMPGAGGLLAERRGVRIVTPTEVHDIL